MIRMNLVPECTGAGPGGESEVQGPDSTMDRGQLKEFVTHGVVSLPSFLTAAQLQHYRDQAWRGLSAEENNGENLLDGRGGGKALDLTPSLDELPQMRALIEQIGGGRFTPEVPLTLKPARAPPPPPPSRI